MDKPASKVCKLTKAFIDELRPDRNPDSKKRKRITCWDSEVKGFGIMVTPITETGGGGVKSYIFQYRMGGRGSDTRRVTIGHHGSEWQPHTARKQAEEYRRLWRQGIDPYEERKRRIAEMQRAYIEEGKEQAKADRLAFPRVREDFVEEYAKPNQPKSWQNTDAALKSLDKFFSRSRVDEMQRGRIKDILDQMTRQQSPSAGIAAHKALRKMFRWLVAEGQLSVSPMNEMKPPAKAKVRKRVLTPSELKEVWDAAETLGYPFGKLVQGLILTGQRLREVAEAEWPEVKSAQSVLLIPAERMKREQSDLRGDHVVPLSTSALKLIEDLPRIAPPSAPDGTTRPALYLFTASGKKPVSGFSVAKVLLDEAIREARKKAALEAGEEWDDSMDMPHWVNHDLRRSMSTALQALGVTPDIIDRIQDHVPAGQSKISRAYQHWDYWDEKKAAVELWGQFLDGAIFGDKKQQGLVKKVGFRLLVDE